MTSIMEDMEELALRIEYLQYLNDYSNPTIEFEEFKRRVVAGSEGR